MDEHKPDNPPIAALSTSLAQGGIIGLKVGCAAVAVTIGALLLGLWLDGVLHTRPWLTLVLLLASMPVTVYIVYRLALREARLAQARERQSGEDKPSL